jgi:hypothetical protein
LTQRGPIAVLPAPYTDLSHFVDAAPCNAHNTLPAGYWASKNERRLAWRYGADRDPEAEARDLWLWNRFGGGYSMTLTGVNNP